MIFVLAFSYLFYLLLPENDCIFPPPEMMIPPQMEVEVSNITCLPEEPIQFVVSAHPTVTDSPGVPYIIQNSSVLFFDGTDCPVNEFGIQRLSVNNGDLYNFAIPLNDSCINRAGANNTVFVYVPQFDGLQSSDDIIVSISCVTPDSVLNITADTVAMVQSVSIQPVDVIDTNTPVVELGVHLSKNNQIVDPGTPIDVGTAIYNTVNLTFNPDNAYQMLTVISMQVKNSPTSPDESLTINVMSDGCDVDGNPVFGNGEVLTQDQTTLISVYRRTNSFQAFRYTAGQSNSVTFVVESRICISSSDSSCLPTCTSATGRKKRQLVNEQSKNLVSYVTLTFNERSDSDEVFEEQLAQHKRCDGLECILSSPVIIGTAVAVAVLVILCFIAVVLLFVKRTTFKVKETVI